MADQETQAPAAPVAEAAPAEPKSAFQAAMEILATNDEPAAEGEQPPAPDEAAPAPVEPPPAPAEPKPDPFAPKFEALHRQERQIREQRKAFEAEKAAAEAAMAPWRKAEELKKAGKHLAAMRVSGIDYQKVVEGLMGGEKGEEAPPPIHPEVAKLQAKVDQMEQAAQVSMLNEYKAKVNAVALASPEKYELVLAKGAVATQSVLDAIGAYYREHNDFPGGSEAAAIEIGLGHIEKALEEEYTPILKTKKFSAKLQSVAPKEETPRPQGIGQPQSTPSRTLTNSLAASPPRAAATPKTEAEYRAEAARILSGG